MIPMKATGQHTVSSMSTGMRSTTVSVMVQSHDFDEYKYKPPAKPHEEHTDWDFLGLAEFRKWADIQTDDEAQHEPSWYEQHREKRIAENEAMMAQLGFFKAWPAPVHCQRTSVAHSPN